MEKASWLSAVVAAVLLAAGVIAEAQQPGQATRIAYLDAGIAAGSTELLDDFRKQMIQFNSIEGKNLAIEYRYAEGKSDRLSELAVELVSLKVDLILVSTVSAA